MNYIFFKYKKTILIFFSFSFQLVMEFLNDDTITKCVRIVIIRGYRPSTHNNHRPSRSRFIRLQPLIKVIHVNIKEVTKKIQKTLISHFIFFIFIFATEFMNFLQSNILYETINDILLSYLIAKDNAFTVCFRCESLS